MDHRLTALVERRRMASPPCEYPSVAGHDAMNLTRHVPTGMLFIPSIGGRSHDGTEDTARWT